MKQITVEATGIYITHERNGSVWAECEDVDEVTLLAQIDVEDAIGHYSTDVLLDAIGRDTAVEYWNIKEIEEM